MTTPQPFFERVHEVTQFCVAHAGRCFGGWPRETVFLYVGFHALAGSLFVVRRHGQIEAVGIAWPFEPETTVALFTWQPVPPGDALMMREVVGYRGACRTMFQLARRRWPFVRRFFAYRTKQNRPQLVEFPARLMERFCG